MGDLAVRVCMGDYVVYDRVLQFQGIVLIGDAIDARVAFPGATIPVVRVGQDYRLRGRTLEEGEELRLSFPNAEVWVSHIPRPRRMRETQTRFDRRFLAVAAVIIAVGCWMDSAGIWVDHQPVASANHAGSTLKRVVDRIQASSRPRRVTAVRSRTAQGGVEKAAPRSADGPRHLPDDRASATAFYRWYRRAIPADPLARGARGRLQVDSTDVAARRTLARAAYNADRFETAAWHYKMIAWLDDADGAALLGLARAERRLGHHTAEITVYRKMLEHWTEHQGALAGLSTALARMGRLDEAMMTLEQLKVVAPDHPYTEVAAATLAALAGRDKDAMEALDKAIGERAQLRPEMQIELRRDLALDPAFASLRKDKQLRGLLRRHLGAAAPRPLR